MQDTRDADRRGHLSLIARMAVATAAIVWVCWGQDWRELAAVFQRLNPAYFAFVVATYAAAQVVIAVRWWLLLRAQSIHIDMSAAVRLFFLGLFYNNVMPGAVGGDVLKAWYVTKHTNKRLEGVLSVVVDRAIGLASLVLMAILTYAVFVRGAVVGEAKPQESGSPTWLSRYEGATVWVAVAVIAALAGVLIHPSGRARLAHAAELIGRRGASLLRRAKEVVIVYCSKPWTLLAAMALTLASQSLVIIAFWLLGRNLGIEAGLRHYFVIFPLNWVVSAVPISIAGLGVLEASLVELFVRLAGAGREEALALAFCQRFVWVLASLPGGLIHLLGAHLPQEEISIDG